MNDQSDIKTKMSWGIFPHEFERSDNWRCLGCGFDSSFGSLHGGKAQLGRYVVGFHDNWRFRQLPDKPIAIVLRCPTCFEIFWVNVDENFAREISKYCPRWPIEGKEKKYHSWGKHPDDLPYSGEWKCLECGYSYFGERFADSVVGFSTEQPSYSRSKSREPKIGVLVFECPRCHHCCWFHVTESLVEEVARRNPLWPKDNL